MSDLPLSGSGNTRIVTDDPQQAIDAALTLKRPLLIKGEPGIGKTEPAIAG